MNKEHAYRIRLLSNLIQGVILTEANLICADDACRDLAWDLYISNGREFYRIYCKELNTDFRAYECLHAAEKLKAYVSNMLVDSLM